MKRILCFCVILLSLSLANAQIPVDLEITDVFAMSVFGILQIENNTTETIEWYFPSAATFDLMVDGIPSAVAYPQVPTWIVIEPGEIYQSEVAHYSMSPYYQGYHVAQIYVGGNSTVTFGDQVSFFVPLNDSEYWELEYTLNLDVISATEVSGLLEMHNPAALTWDYIFPNLDVAEIWIDDQPAESIPFPFVWELIIEAGTTQYVPVYSCFSDTLSEGTHLATAHLLIPGSPQVGEGVSFNIGPVQVSDQLLPAVSPMKVYPNPFDREIALEMKTNANAPLSFSIYNLRGQKVRELHVTPQNGIAKALWDGRDESGKTLARGVYILKSSNPKPGITKRIIKL